MSATVMMANMHWNMTKTNVGIEPDSDSEVIPASPKNSVGSPSRPPPTSLPNAGCVVEQKTDDSTLASVLDVDSLNDTYALASELGVDVFEVYEAMQRGEARAEDALNNEDSRNNSAVHEDGDGHSSGTDSASASPKLPSRQPARRRRMAFGKRRARSEL